VGEERLGGDAASLEGLLDDRIGNILGGSRGHGSFDQDQAMGFDLFSYDLADKPS